MKKLLVFAVSIIMLLASVSAASACIFSGHQPELPDALK